MIALLDDNNFYAGFVRVFVHSSFRLHGFPLSALKVIRGTAVKLAAGRPLSGEFWPRDGKPVRNFAINAWIDGTETGFAAIVTRNIATLHTFWD